MPQPKITNITIKKVAQGRYEVYKDKEKVATAIFTPKYYPAPFLPRGYQIVVKFKGRPTLTQIVRTIAEGRQKILQEFR